MRLIEMKGSGGLSLTENFTEDIPRYAILSHTWGGDNDEVTFAEFIAGAGRDKTGYKKIEFCQKQAAKDGLQYFWLDTCCIDKSNPAELSEAINSMFHWYRDAVKCYVYLIDVSTRGAGAGESISRSVWGLEFRQSRWFTRAWTLQELIAPATVEFFSREGERLGDKGSEEASLEKITGIPVEVFRGKSIAEYTANQWMIWATERTATRKEDEAYCLLGIFNVHMSLKYGEGRAKAFARLQNKIQKHSQNRFSDTSSVIHGNVHWMVPRAVNDIFTGRAELLARMQQALRVDTTSKPAKQRRFVITGLGGQGKSEVCLQVAGFMQKEFWGIFWVDVGTSATAERDFLTIAKLIGRPVETISEALQVLANSQQSWLLILDNADDPHYDYQIYLPSGNHGAVLITSRVAECKQYSPDAYDALQGLESKESKELLRKAAGISLELWATNGNQAAAEKIVQLLASHTLALIQAGAYVAQGHCHLSQYPRVFQQQRERLMKYHSKQAQSRYHDVYATFEASAEVLEQSHSKTATDALRLLEVLSMLDSGFLPLQIFQDAWKGCKEFLDANPIRTDSIVNISQSHVSSLPSFVVAEEAEWDSYRLLEATSLLASLSLVTRHDLDGLLGISMHPLTHAWAKDRQSTKQQGAAWISSGCVLAFSWSSDHLWRTQARCLLPHMQSYLNINIKKAFSFASETTILPIILRCGRALSQMRQDFTLGRLLQDVFSGLKLNSDQPSEELLPLYDLQARSLLNLGKSKETVALLEQVIKIRDTTLAKDHPDRLASQHALAIAYEANGQVKEAVVLLEQVVRIRETTQAEDHPDRLNSQHALAIAYRANGQVKEAVVLLEQVVRIRETTQAEDHPDRLASQHALAIAYRANGQVKEAVVLLEQVVKLKQLRFHQDHPSRIVSEDVLSYFLQKHKLFQLGHV